MPRREWGKSINNDTGMIRAELIAQYWWPGDNLANLPGITYDGF
jgi:hypothetical protein